MDQNKKTMRHFYCRDVLWETFEQMANDFDCSIDYLINESMRHYARAKNYQVAASGQHNAVGADGDDGVLAKASATPPIPQPPPVRPRNLTPPPPPAPQQAQMDRRPTSNLPAMTPTPPISRPPRETPTTPVHSSPAATPAMSKTPEPTGSSKLYLIYEGKRMMVDKDQFIIGRGSKTADLAIRDGNISRKHAAVIRRNGTFYIKDLGSTNGIDYKGMRIDNKRIDDGDIFHLCDYAIEFTYA